MNTVSPDSADFKVCIKCGPPAKPLSEFNKQRAQGDGLDYYCKSCRRAVNKENYEKRKLKTADEQEEWSTNLGRAILAERGIPCAVGRDAGLAYVDLLAWSCVQVEVKVGRPIDDHPNKFKWGFTSRQRRVGFKGIFLFVALYPDESYRVFIVPCTDPHITKADGSTFVTAVSVVIGALHMNAKNWDWLKQYENAFDLIEAEREKHIAELKTGATASIKRALAEISKRPPNLSLEELPLFRKAA